MMILCALYALMSYMLKIFWMKRVDHCLYVVALQDCNWQIFDGTSL